MYCDHFGFGEPPFALTPNPAFLFLSSHHQEAFAHLLYGIENRAGFIELSGEVGTGKTTVIRTFLNQLAPDAHRTALIFNPTLSPLGLLQGICREFGLPGTSSEKGELLDELNRFLLDENRAGRTVVLVIDEAQNLAPEVLEQIRLISNLETERSKLIQIVLVGQPELRRLLSREDLRQLNQRITVRYHLEPMGFTDAQQYIRHRIRVAAGGREPVTFSAAAVKRIFRFSGGLPRLINAACDRALLVAYTREAREISPAMAAAAIADVRREEGRRPLVPRLAAVLAMILLVAAAVAGTLALSRSREQPLATTAPKEPAEPPLSPAAALATLAATNERENLHAAAGALIRAWRAAPPTAADGGDLRTIARQRGFTVTDMTGTLDILARIDTPTLLHITLPGGGTRYLALTGLDGDRAAIAPALKGRTTLSRQELAAIWGGRASLIWLNYHAIPARLRPGSSGKGVRALQELLKGAGHFGGAVTGIYDAATEEAVRKFQQAEGLDTDGRAGGKTLFLLHRRAGTFFPPGLAPGESGADNKTKTEKERKG